MKSLFFTQIAVGALAAAVFRMGLDPRVAGLIAGAGFIAVGGFGVYIGWWRRRGYLSVVVALFSSVHLFGVALPMLAFRVMNWSEPFSKVSVWGLSGPDFHQISMRFYGAWLVIVGVAWWFERKRDPRGSLLSS